MTNDLYLLTGATGLLGGNLVRELVSKGKKVRALVLPHDPALASVPQGVDIVEGDLLDGKALERFFSVPENTDVSVIHAAGIVTLDPKPNERTRAINVDGTENIVEQCVRHHVKKLIYISSTSVLPELPGNQAIREIEHYDPDGVVGYYAKTKAMATQIVLRAAREKGLDASIVCPSGIFGPDDYGFGLITSCVRMVAEGKLPASIGGSFNSVDARDLAAGILACAEKGRKGETYIMANRCFSFDGLIGAICDETGIRKPRVKIPLSFLRPIAGLGGLYGKITHRPAWFSRFTIYNLERNNNYSAEKAERELGFHCRPMEDTIRDTIAWLKREGRINRGRKTPLARNP